MLFQGVYVALPYVALAADVDVMQRAFATMASWVGCDVAAFPGTW